jgi:hypothetical protein
LTFANDENWMESVEGRDHHQDRFGLVFLFFLCGQRSKALFLKNPVKWRLKMRCQKNPEAIVVIFQNSKNGRHNKPIAQTLQVHLLPRISRSSLLVISRDEKSPKGQHYEFHNLCKRQRKQ